MEGLGTIEKRLYDAAAIGDTVTLRDLLGKDPLLIERVSSTCPNKTPLHVASMRGHLAFVQEILNHNPQLAEQLDSQQMSPLHIASDKGYVDIVKMLISAAPNMCLSRDCQGRNPLHLAAIKGHVEMVKELVRTAPLAGREKADRGQTALHLCVKHRKLGALNILVQNLGDIIDARDDNGDTVLHLAVRDNQIEISQYLVNAGIDVMATNSMGQTAREISEQYQEKRSELTKILIPRFILGLFNKKTLPDKWLTRKRDSIMVVAILIAAMAFQAGVSPPGGVWQDNLTHDPQGNPVANPHIAGEAIMAYRRGTMFKNFVRCNTVAFASSIMTIFLLLSDLKFGRNLFTWFLMFIMWLTVLSIAVTYAMAITVVHPQKKDMGTSGNYIVRGIVAWGLLMVTLFVRDTILSIHRWLKNGVMMMWSPTRSFNNENVAQVNHV